MLAAIAIGRKSMELHQQRRMTRQRRVILEELAKVTSHPSADEVYAMVRRRIPRISMGTVYRNLDVLWESGTIQKLVSGGSQMRFDANAAVHYHVRCVRCGRVDDVAMDPPARIEERAANVTKYKILGHSLEFAGVCPACKKREATGQGTD